MTTNSVRGQAQLHPTNRYWRAQLHPTNRYLIVFDKNNEICGIMKLHTEYLRTPIILQFFNDEELVYRPVREVSKSEWETMEAFELFPIFTPYYRDPGVPPTAIWPHPIPQDKLHITTIFKVRVHG